MPHPRNVTRFVNIPNAYVCNGFLEDLERGVYHAVYLCIGCCLGPTSYPMDAHLDVFTAVSNE